MMGREIKRVPLDFDWPLNKVWPGYLNPYDVSTECPACEGTGCSPEARAIEDQWYNHTGGAAGFTPESNGSTPYTLADYDRLSQTARWVAVTPPARWLATVNSQWCHHLNQDDVDALLAAGRLMDFTRAGIEHPTPAQVNDWSFYEFGHDAINRWVVVEARCHRLGILTECNACHGDGFVWPTRAEKALADTWFRLEPPLGDGWQLWETVSEGSPVSPVFPTEESFKAYLIGEGFGPKAVEAFIQSGWCMSAMITPQGDLRTTIDTSGGE
jgi:hypothetical protein